MDSLKRMLILPLVVFVTAGCELLCQAGSGTCGLSDEQVDRLLHPKGYGEYWTKPGMTKECWRQDWVACGGRSNGTYSVGKRLPGETDDFANSDRVTKRLDACMQAKGYTFSYTNL